MKKELALLGIVSVLSLILLIGVYKVSIQGDAIVALAIEPMELFGYSYGYAAATPEPEIRIIPPKIEFWGYEASVSSELLTPTFMEFFVNEIPVPSTIDYNFFPMDKEDLNSFAGRFGFYDFDPTSDITVKLCTYPNKFSNRVIACETVNLNYDPVEGTIFFARGYAEDEYIGNQALRNFGALYYVVGKGHGILAQSNVGIIRYVN